MSWSFSAKIEEGEDVAQTLADAMESNFENMQSADAQEEMQSQANAAIDAVVALVGAEVLGPPPYTLNLSGHANPGFEDREGFSKNTVSIYVSQVSA